MWATGTWADGTWAVGTWGYRTPQAMWAPGLWDTAEVFPTPDQVKVGVRYGPTGLDYVGTFTGLVPSDDANVCRLTGYLVNIDNRPVAGVSIDIALRPAVLAANARLLAQKFVKVTTDAQGCIRDSSGNPFVDLAQNSAISLGGNAVSWYEVTCPALNVISKRITLNAATADLRALLLAEP